MNRSYTYIFVSLLAITHAGCQHSSSAGKQPVTAAPENPIEKLQAEIRLYPDSMRLRSRLAQNLRENGDFSEAVHQIDTILKKDSLTPAIHHFRAELLLDLKDTASATVAMEKAYELAPQSDAQYSLAYLYAASGNMKALALCDTMIRKMTRQNPKGDPYYIKGIYYLRLADTDKALKSFNQSINIDHTLMEAYTEKGRLYFKGGKYKEALSVFKLATTVSNTYADAYYWQGRCFEALGQPDEAVTNYQKAVGLDPDFHQARDAMKKLGN